MPIFWLDSDTGEQPKLKNRGANQEVPELLELPSTFGDKTTAVLILLAIACCSAVIIAGLFS